MRTHKESDAELFVQLLWAPRVGDRIRIKQNGQETRSRISQLLLEGFRIEDGRYTVLRENCRFQPRLPEYEKVLTQLLVHMNQKLGRQVVLRVNGLPVILTGRPKKMLSRFLALRFYCWEVQQAVNQLVFSVRGKLGEF
jgi:hypothetical protein